jgi:hypothetical protein
MKANVTKTKVLLFERHERMAKCKVLYLGSMLTRDGKCDSDVENRVNAGNIVNGDLHAFLDIT